MGSWVILSVWKVILGIAELKGGFRYLAVPKACIYKYHRVKAES